MSDLLGLAGICCIAAALVWLFGGLGLLGAGVGLVVVGEVRGYLERSE